MTTTPDALWSSRAIRILQPAAIVCEGVRRRVGPARLLDGVDLRVGIGARVLLVGIPDAASTMLLKILAGLRRADRGRIEMAGLSRADDSPIGWARRIAYVGREPAIYPWLTAREALGMTASLLEIERGEGRRRVTAAIDYWQLADGLDRPIGRNGDAYRQRVAVAAALLGEAEVILLDEPLRAVDPDERIRLLRLPGSRRTVIVASQHPASEAGIVDQLVLLRGGRIALHVPLAALDEHGLAMSVRGIGRLADRIGEPLPTAAAGHALADRSRASA